MKSLFYCCTVIQSRTPRCLQTVISTAAQITAMAAIGSLVFCTDCGNLLDGSSGDDKAILECDVCGTGNQGITPAVNVPTSSYLCADAAPVDTSTSAITTRSKPTAFPSALRSKLSAVQTLTEDDVQKGAVIRQTCPECGSKEMRYYTQQLRSADEGTTVFYSCDTCGHKYALCFRFRLPFRCTNAAIDTAPTIDLTVSRVSMI